MTFKPQPTLSGKLVTLRPLTLDDFNELFAVASDPLIWEQHPAKVRATKKGFADFFKESIDSGGALAIIDNLTQKIIGSSRYFGYNSKTSDIEIGWTFISRTYWGGKYNAEIKDLMLSHAFNYVSSVVFLVDKENIRSQKAMHKIGGKIDPQPDSKGRLVFRIRKDERYSAG